LLDKRFDRQREKFNTNIFILSYIVN